MRPDRLLGRLGPRAFRHMLNLYPPIRATGARVKHISDDWQHWRLELPLTWRNTNYVGTLFGGSLYAAMDPHFMLAFLRILGPDYVVWDKAASIRFRRPGRTRLFGEILIPGEEVEAVRQLCLQHEKVDRTYHFQWRDRDGVVHVEVEKVLHFRYRTPVATGPA